MTDEAKQNKNKKKENSPKRDIAGEMIADLLKLHYSKEDLLSQEQMDAVREASFPKFDKKKDEDNK